MNCRINDRAEINMLCDRPVLRRQEQGQRKQGGKPEGVGGTGVREWLTKGFRDPAEPKNRVWLGLRVIFAFLCCSEMQIKSLTVCGGRLLWWEKPEVPSLADLDLRSGFITEEACGFRHVSSGLGG